MSQTQIIKQIRAAAPRTAVRPFKAGDFALFAPTNVPLFTITGAIIVQGFFGIVTVISAGATTIAISLTTTLGGIVTPVAVATASIDTHPIGTIYTLAGGVGAALTMQIGAARGVGVYSITNQQAWIAGTLGMVIGGAANTGQIDWYLQYIPAAPGSYANPT